MTDRRRMPRPLAAGLLAAALLAALRGGVAAAILGGDPVAEIRVVRSPADAFGALAERLPGAGGRLLMLSQYPHMADLILPLAEKGILKELAVVVPSEQPLGPGALDGIRSSLAEVGVPSRDLDTLRFDNGVVRGTVGGTPAAWSALQGVPLDPRPRVVVIETFFLFGVYKSEASAQMLDLAGKLFVTLRKRAVDAAAVVVLDSTLREDFPLEYGDQAMMLREMAQSPQAFDDAVPEKWLLRKKADLLYYFMQTEEAAAAYREWNEIEPRDGSAPYRLALIAARDLDEDRALRWMDAAAAADPAFGRGYLEVARIFDGRNRGAEAERILRGGLARFPGDPGLATGLARFLVAQGDGASSRGAHPEAERSYREAAALAGADPGVTADAKAKLGAALRLRGAPPGGAPR